jgi:hypothetical protein
MNNTYLKTFRDFEKYRSSLGEFVSLTYWYELKKEEWEGVAEDFGYFLLEQCYDIEFDENVAYQIKQCLSQILNLKEAKWRPSVARRINSYFYWLGEVFMYRETYTWRTPVDLLRRMEHFGLTRWEQVECWWCEGKCSYWTRYASGDEQEYLIPCECCDQQGKLWTWVSPYGTICTRQLFKRVLGEHYIEHIRGHYREIREDRSPS